MLPLQELKRLYSNEQVVLVLLARLYFSTATQSEVAAFIQHHPIDWELAYKIARAHGVRPFTFYAIDQHNIEVHPVFREKLQKDYRIAMMNTVQLSLQIAGLVNHFKEKGIIIIPYKGAVLAHSYYKNMALRESSDIDFIVDRKDVAAIEDYFLANGYIPRQTVPRSYLKFEQLFFKEIVYSLPVSASGRSNTVEIHWTLTNRFAGKYAEYPFFRSHVESYQLNSLSLHKLAPAYDLVAIVSNHFVKDMFVRFKHITDIACFLQRHPGLPDDHIIFPTAKKYGFEKRLRVGLTLVNDLVGIPSNPRYTGQKIPDRYLATPVQYPILLPRLQFNEPGFLKRSLELQDSFVQQCTFLARSFLYIFIPTYIDINTFKLPVYFFPVLVILRPFRLLYERIKPGRKK
jgi:hypothetical protein